MKSRRESGSWSVWKKIPLNLFAGLVLGLATVAFMERLTWFYLVLVVAIAMVGLLLTVGAERIGMAITETPEGDFQCHWSSLLTFLGTVLIYFLSGRFYFDRLLPGYL